MIRAAVGGREVVAVVSVCNIKTAGGKIIIIVPEINCAGRLVSVDFVQISLIG